MQNEGKEIGKNWNEVTHSLYLPLGLWFVFVAFTPSVLFTAAFT